MKFTARAYRDENDYVRIKAFLREVFLLNQRREYCWQAARLDYWRYFVNEHIDHYPLSRAIHLWETPSGEIAGVVTADGRGNAYLNVHPRLKTRHLERAMLNAAEVNIADVGADRTRRLTIWSHQDDEQRRSLLEDEGYAPENWQEFQFSRSLSEPVQPMELADGYVIRSLGGLSELPARSWMSWLAFHPSEPQEHYEGWEWYLDVQRCPLYQRDLDLVVVAPDGELAAFCTLWLDHVTGTGYFEPVGTSPEHQRRGLGKAIMTEGLRKLRDCGAAHACVSGSSDPAKRLYQAVMREKPLVHQPWQKTWS